jgi:UDP-N-acetylglucosamine acyltransferase
MPAIIHPTAIIEPGVQLGEDVEVGAYAYLGGTAVIGARTRIQHHATVEGNTVLGVECDVFPYACIGGKTQDLKYKGGNPGVRIGDRNVFREYVSVHAATGDGLMTKVGSNNTILAYSHVAHDCVLGSHIIMSNYAGLAGHSVVEDHVVVGAYGGVHQFCRLGAYSMLSACSKLVQDIPPFFIADGSPATIRAYNKVGLERQGFSAEQLDRVKQIFRILYRDGLNRTQAMEKLEAHAQAGSDEFQRLLKFAKTSERGLVPGV